MKRNLLIVTLAAFLILSGCSNTNETSGTVEQNLASLQYNLAHKYYYGDGVLQNYSQAASLYLKSAELGHAQAQIFLGYMYEDGLGVTQSYSEAIIWYRKAAEQDLANAQNNLGDMYRDGEGVAGGDVEAVKWSQMRPQGNCVVGDVDL